MSYDPMSGDGPWDDFDCPECGKMVPASSGRCGCGWDARIAAEDAALDAYLSEQEDDRWR